MRKKERDYTLARRVVNHWRQFGHYFLGDYYPLTPYSQDKKVWMAWQFDCPEAGEGLVQAFRRGEPRASVRKTARAGFEYHLYVDESGHRRRTEVTGRELLEVGLPIRIPDRPGAVIITYAKETSPASRQEELTMKRFFLMAAFVATVFARPANADIAVEALDADRHGR